jgi:putative tryptophan/tyrosine transport system substrate-binding protein
MHRRDVIRATSLLLSIAAVRDGLAQARARETPARLAILDDAVESVRAHLWQTFRNRLSDLGYVEGRSLIIEARWAGGDLDRLSTLAAELVALRPDVLVTITATVALIAKKATSVIPIVAVGPADPVKLGLITSLARPGGNVTGLSPNQVEIAGKWVEMVREIVPRAKVVAYLTDLGNPGEVLVLRELQERARPLGIAVQSLHGVAPSSLVQAFAAMKRNHADALIVATSTSVLSNRSAIVAASAQLRIPTLYAREEYPEAGGLLSYGANLEVLYARAADYVHRILQGAQPAELPFEMASTFKLVVNLATARALGLRLPQPILVRADKVIQ